MGNEIEFLKKELEKSGYPLENYVSSCIASKEKWRVQANAYFLDKDIGEGRELDLKASRDFSTDAMTMNVFIPTLLIQCKRIPGNAWIFFRTPSSLSTRISKIGLSDFLKVGDLNIFHKGKTHFMKSELMATNYCEIITDRNKSNKRTDNIWKSVITLIKATSEELEFALLDEEGYLVDDLSSPEEFSEHPFELISIVYPVIVFEGKMYEATFDKEIALKRRRYVQLFVDYKSGNYEGEFCIDIVTKEYFAEYFDWVNKDLKVFEKRLVKKTDEYKRMITQAVTSYLKRSKHRLTQ